MPPKKTPKKTAKKEVKKGAGKKTDSLQDLKKAYDMMGWKFDSDDFKYMSSANVKKEIALIKKMHKKVGMNGGGLEGTGFFDTIANLIPSVTKFIPLVGPLVSGATDLTLKALNPLRSAENRYKG